MRSEDCTRVSDLPERMGAGWRPVLELATGTVSYGPFPTAAHAEKFAYAKEVAEEDEFMPHMRVLRVEHRPDTSANIAIVHDWS